MEAIARTQSKRQSATAVLKPEAFISQEIELMLHPPHGAGTISYIRGLLTGHSIEILASSPYAEGRSQQWLVVVHDGERAAAVLREAGMECVTESVLLIEAPLRSSACAILGTTLMGQGIGIQYTYSTAGDSRMTTVFKTTDGCRAFNLLAGVPRAAHTAN